MSVNLDSKRIQIANDLAAYYRAKFAKDTGRQAEEYAGLWVSWDDSKRSYCLRGEGLPSHPDLADSHPNGWSLIDYIKPTEAAKLLGLPAPKREETSLRLSAQRIPTAAT